ncbi:MAG: metal ABC transporter substrate-binding protein [Eubacteriales bacterium]|nr:metal ABC transporter substrate-binding protein [Eubacteriales bacterium]MDD4475139.1 metal ABC transporter substrate-binding protein [Eubacteriales bacterium]
MKKVVLILTIVALLLGTSAGCGEVVKQSEKLKVVVTTFPPYDWVRRILGDKADEAELTLLLDSGVDMHSYQPNTDDIIKITTSDVFIYVGGTSDTWVDDVLKNAVNKDMKVINLIDELGDAVKEEEVKEGMDDDHDDHDDHSEDEADFDEHVWLSLKNAMMFSEKIAAVLGQADSENETTYKSNADKYIDELSALDKRYEDAVSEAAHKTIVFADRFPFRYLVDDYGIDYYAAFVGCSAETEASFDTVVFLAEKLNELSLDKILIIETSDGSIARTVRDSSNAKNQEILVLDSIQSVSQTEIDSGTTFISIMESNLEILQKALGKK